MAAIVILGMLAFDMSYAQMNELYAQMNEPSDVDRAICKDLNSALQNIHTMVAEIHNYTVAATATPLPHDCPFPWKRHKQFCYFISSSKVNWFAAAQTCQQNDAWLVEIEDEEIEALLMVAAIDGNTEVQLRYWTGLNDLASEGNFNFWQSGKQLTPTSYSNWEGNQPDDYKSDEDCVELRQKHGTNDWGWNDVQCKNTMIQFICQKYA